MTLMRNQELAKSASGLERLVGSLLVFDNIIDMHNRIGSRVCICIHITIYQPRNPLPDGVQKCHFSNLY